MVNGRDGLVREAAVTMTAVVMASLLSCGCGGGRTTPHVDDGRAPDGWSDARAGDGDKADVVDVDGDLDGDAECQPTCTSKCAGAPDNCGGSCPTTDCDSGCCTSDHVCVSVSIQSDTTCGMAAATCSDCTGQSRVCRGATCVDDVPNSAAFVEQSVPVDLAPGAQAGVTITMRNLGTQPWMTTAGYKLGSESPQDNARWGMGRVDVDASDSIGPGATKTFAFTITAPTTPGVYAFQWRMVQETVMWFGELSPRVMIRVGSAAVQVCEAVRALAGVDADASATLQTCLDAVPAGAAVELPAGVYRLDHPVLIRANPMTLRTEGKEIGDARCAEVAHDCAELRASTAFVEMQGLLQVLVNGSSVDHLVIHGNKAARRGTGAGAECVAGHNSYGSNMRLACDDCALTNSVTRDALCGTGCEVSGVRSRVTLWRNAVLYNGVHDASGLWADGVTVHDAIDSTFADNDIADNTDVDMILGGCVRCLIQNNSISHSSPFAVGSFAALMLHAWSTTSGDYTGSLTSFNTIDCGPERRCGIGLYIGSDAWYNTDTFGGTVRNNIVTRAQFGLLIDDAHDMAVHHNEVSDSDWMTAASCGLKFVYDYGMGEDTVGIDTAGDGVSYHDVDFDGCVPNWWDP